MEDVAYKKAPQSTMINNTVFLCVAHHGFLWRTLVYFMVLDVNTMIYEYVNHSKKTKASPSDSEVFYKGSFPVGFN